MTVDTFFQPRWEVAGRAIGAGAPVWIIAEAGVNHFGDLERAYRLVELALDGGADCVKFQLFKTESFIASTSPEWQERMRVKELTAEDMLRVRDYALARGILFLASAHDGESLDILIKAGVPALKVGSGEMGNVPYLRQCARSGLPVIVSTGMHGEEDVERIRQVFREEGNPKLALLHCTTLYPTELDEVRLRAMDSLAEGFTGPVGYSDHTLGYEAVLAAVARGASIIEKHIALEKEVPGTWDPLVSCYSDTLGPMVGAIRRVESMLGVPGKMPASREKSAVEWARKSIVAARDLPEGQILCEADVRFKRPGTGLSPHRLPELIGRKLLRSVSADHCLLLEDVR
jgi:N-acetylneuraminate synthase/N,N'-diacetyllegionaminate synthase